jgi:hypothetical protein
MHGPLGFTCSRGSDNSCLRCFPGAGDGEQRECTCQFIPDDPRFNSMSHLTQVRVVEGELDKVYRQWHPRPYYLNDEDAPTGREVFILGATRAKEGIAGPNGYFWSPDAVLNECCSILYNRIQQRVHNSQADINFNELSREFHYLCFQYFSSPKVRAVVQSLFDRETSMGTALHKQRKVQPIKGNNAAFVNNDTYFKPARESTRTWEAPQKPSAPPAIEITELPESGRHTENSFQSLEEVDA